MIGPSTVRTDALELTLIAAVLPALPSVRADTVAPRVMLLPQAKGPEKLVLLGSTVTWPDVLMTNGLETVTLSAFTRTSLLELVTSVPALAPMTKPSPA